MTQRFQSVALIFTVAVAMIATACTPTGIGDPCEPEVESEGGLGEDETVVETSSLQCRTRVCMSFNRQSFCTTRCTTDADCLAEWYEDGPEAAGEDEEWPPAYCEAEVTVGSPGVIGSYCVPERASRLHSN